MDWNGKGGRPSEYDPPKQEKPMGKEVGKSGVITHGVDFSFWQPNVNWKYLASLKDEKGERTYKFAMLKATDGQGGIDAQFEKNFAKARAEGFIVGAYCFGRFHAGTENQAELLRSVVAGKTKWVCYDVEWDNSKATKEKFGTKYGEGGKMDDFAADHAHQTLYHLEAFGFSPWIYSNTYYFTGFKNPERFARFPYWASNYQQKDKAEKDLDVTKVPLPKPFKSAVCWQWHNKHPLAKAVTGDPDMDANIYFGGIEELKELAGQ